MYTKYTRFSKYRCWQDCALRPSAVFDVWYAVEDGSESLVSQSLGTKSAAMVRKLGSAPGYLFLAGLLLTSAPLVWRCSSCLLSENSTTGQTAETGILGGHGTSVAWSEPTLTVLPAVLSHVRGNDRDVDEVFQPLQLAHYESTSCPSCPAFRTKWGRRYGGLTTGIRYI